jgi:hypothetical protein
MGTYTSFGVFMRKRHKMAYFIHIKCKIQTFKIFYTLYDTIDITFKKYSNKSF